jgi:maltose alpha-D-glucosyltransferase/alpha-amylase
VRRRHVVLGRGDISLLQPENPKVLAFVRRYQDQRLLVVANLSRSAQYVELDLKEYAGLVPVELFSRQAFPAIREQPLLLTFGPHDFYWFSLEPMETSRAEITTPELTRPPPTVDDLCSSHAARKELANLLPDYLKARRWFRSKARTVVSVSIADTIPLGAEPHQLALLLVHVDFRSGDPETYLLPVAVAKGEEAWKLLQQHPQAAIVHSKPADGGEEIVLYDAVYSSQLPEQLLELFARRKELPASQGALRSWPLKTARSGNIKKGLSAVVSNAEQSNTSLLFEGEYICKLFRRLDRGINPEIEIGRVLAEQAEFTQSPALLGAIEYQASRQEAATVATLQRFMPHQNDAWSLTRDALQSFYENCLALPAAPPASERDASGAAQPQQPRSLLDGSLLEKARSSLPEAFADLAGVFPAEIRLLGQRTAELHRALAASSDPQFTPEPFNTMYQRSLYESTRTRLKRAMATLRRHRPSLSEHEQQTADELLARQGEFDSVLRKLVTSKLDVQKIRVHGDYHLGQVLFTGKDFIIIDFEGEPGRTLAERRFKHCGLRDVASMARSLDYAALSALRTGAIRADDVARLELWARAWSSWMSASFVQAYLAALDEHAGLVPANDADCSALLDYYLLDKCLYELEYEFNNRPDWISIPLFGLVSLLPSTTPAGGSNGSASGER